MYQTTFFRLFLMEEKSTPKADLQYLWMVFAKMSVTAVLTW